MPTLILLDASLSMSRTSGKSSLKELAIHGINAFLDQLSQHNPLEFVALSTFSSCFSLETPFSRHHDPLRSCLSQIEEQDTTNIKEALSSACAAIHLKWGLLLPAQVLMITDGEAGLEVGGMEGVVDDDLLTNSTCSIIVVSLHSPDTSTPTNPHTPLATTPQPSINPTTNHLLNTYFPSRHKIYTPDLPLSHDSVGSLFGRICINHNTPSRLTLRCGNHLSNVHVYPPIVPPNKEVMWGEMVVCGSLDLSDLSSPPFHSRHLVLPVSDPSDDKDTADRQATFTVLLHGSLKVEGMVALVQISAAWFGILYVQPDSKKKSNLNLSLFKYGDHTVPWMGRFIDLEPSNALHASALSSGKSPFPVTTYPDKKSYSQNCVVWIHNVGLQGDLQKIIRNARKIPEKQTQFYKELNRVRKAALSIGFFELFPSLASLLERESHQLPPTAHPSCPLQLTHAAEVLRSVQALDVNQHIHPLPIN